MTIQPKLILASGSPRRRELLSLLGLEFQVHSMDVPETVTEENLDPARMVEALSYRKAEAAALYQITEEGYILGADTIVAVDGNVLGKPSDADDARHMLQMLQGRAHEVYTGVTLLGIEDGKISKKRTFHCRTVVHVHTMDPEEIEDYIRTGDPFDKAGSYGIQGPFAAYVDGIEGDYQNVVGLPVSMVYREWRKLTEA